MPYVCVCIAVYQGSCNSLSEGQEIPEAWVTEQSADMKGDWQASGKDVSVDVPHGRDGVSHTDSWIVLDRLCESLALETVSAALWSTARHSGDVCITCVEPSIDLDP